MKNTQLHLRSAVAGWALLALLGLAGCNGKSSTLASVNGRTVKQAEFDAYLRLKHISPADEKRRERALEEFLEREALSNAIESESKADKELVEAELRETKKELLISRHFDRFLDEKVTDEAVKNYYDANAKNYEQRKVHVAHILVRTNGKMSDEERKARLTAIQEIHAKLAAGQSFEELAKTLSEDKISGAKGGDLSWLREGSIDPEFSKRAFSTKAGVVTEPFETAFGYHILRVLEAPRVVRKPYDAVLGDIRHQLRAEAKEAELKRLKAKLQISRKGPYRLDQKALAAAQTPQSKDAAKNSPLRAPERPSAAKEPERDPSIIRTSAPAGSAKVQP